MGTDYVDLFFIHSFGDNHSLDDAMNFVKSQEFKEAADAIRKSGKARFVGISTHHKDRAQILQAAAEGGIVDAIMLQYTPWLDKDAPLNKALDACWKKGIGLISMKQIAGHFLGGEPRREHPRRGGAARSRCSPSGSSRRSRACCTRSGPTSGSAPSCVSMKNTDHIRENADAARRFEPLKAADIRQLRDAALAHGPMLCADCDGRCSVAAGTTAELGNLTRFLTYHEHHGHRAEARRLLRRALRRGPRLVRRRPRSRPRRLPQPARLRPAPARGRPATWRDFACREGVRASTDAVHW